MTVDETLHLELAHFEGLLGTAFPVRVEGAPEDLALELVEIRKLQENAGTSRKPPFALEFRGPMEPVLNQGMFPVVHPELGDLAIFMVPVGPDDQGMRYEAVFN